jgi:periplasmic copper chaperone A
MKFSHLLLSSLLVAPTVFANSSITFDRAYARATPPKAPTSAVFAEIYNRGTQDKVLVSATTNVASKVELHDVIINGDIMKMRQVHQMIIPAGRKLELQPGSLHIMLLGLKGPLKEGDTITMTAHFADGEILVFDAPVKKVMQGIAMMPHSQEPTSNQEPKLQTHKNKLMANGK